MNDSQRIAAVRAHMDYEGVEAYLGGWKKPTAGDTFDNPNVVREWRSKIDTALLAGTMPRDGYGERSESEPCDAGTPGCSVVSHQATGKDECETY